ncbi:Nn.00g026130.m01.CDS01 [Neocucurbitaria sp. VM-36]
MARRSARLQKRSTTPADTSMRSSDSWQTASSPHLELPSLPELPDPNLKTPQKPIVEPVSKLPQATPTPLKSKPSKSVLTAVTSRTPKDRTPIKPAGQEMHPAHHHASTAKVLDEARWLGFQALGAYTAPPKALTVGQATPSKTPVPTPANKAADMQSSPEFRFRFKSPFSMLKGSKQDEAGLSPSSRNILKDAAISGTPGGGSRALFGTTEFSTKADMSPQRKKVEPKGKMARFSDVHMSQFKKMDSIANHPSAFRADPSRFKPVIGQPLKKSPSKPDLAKAQTNSLKRTQSKIDMADSSVKTTGGLKRTQSKMDIGESARKLPPTPSQRTLSGIDPATTGLPRSQSTVRLIPSTQNGRPASREGDSNITAKRVKRTESDDAATTRPKSSEGKPVAPTPAAATPARKITSQTALPRLAARLMTPTKSSIARSQSVKVAKSSSMIPSLAKSPSTNNLFSPTNIAQTMRDGARESMRKATHNLQRVRSILRTPSRKFSDDPTKIVAGTHMSPPPALNFAKALPPIPATAPVKKHVNFTNSTLERTADIELTNSPSPVKFRAGSEMPTGAVVYPTLQPNVQYPDLSQDDEIPAASPSRRLTFGGEAVNQARQFSFDSGKQINFGPASTGTIRMVRKSDASTLVDNKKRKLDTLQEASDKENDEPAEEDMRSTKKMKPAPAAPPKTPASTSKLPRRTPARGSARADTLQPCYFGKAQLHATFTVASSNKLVDDLKKTFNFFKNHPYLGTTSSPPIPDNRDRPTDFLSIITGFLQKCGLDDIAAFITNPRFNDPTYLTTLAIALATVFITMSWFSRSGGSGGWGGRFSPFGRPGSSPNAGVVNDSDFSYITSEDLRRNGAAQAPEIVDWDDKNPERETDVLIFKEKRTHYPTHFPAHSIRDGDLKIGTVRQAAAKKLGIDNPARIRMFYKGRNLKHDERTAREEGLRGDGSGSEILVTVGEAPVGGLAPGSVDAPQRPWSDGEDEEDDDEDDVDSGANTTGKKKSRKRGGRKSKKKGSSSANASGTSTPGYVGAGAGAEYLPIPSHINAAPRPTSAPPQNPPRAATPVTPMGKLDAIASKFHTEFVPLAIQYMSNPPEEKAKREFEYKKLSETILTQIIFKLDSVETEGDSDARLKRKALVKEVQSMLTKLDEVGKAG